MRFDEFDLGYDVLDALDAMHFEECTPIQERAIGPVLDGRDIIAVAQTGTGKTAAYLLPIISLINDGGYPEDAINCVIMVPTHELAQQIDRQLEGFSYFVSVSSAAIHGGNDGKEFARQQRSLKMGADIVIATPGRLLAHMKMGYVDLSRTSFFVLDEADRMLDMGFSDDIMQIARQLPKERQTLLFSATMPPKIQQLASNILNDPLEVKIAVSKPSEKIDQSAVICHEGQKSDVLKYLFHTYHSKRVIVFAASKLKVKDLSRELRRAGWRTGEMHSDLEQPEREKVMHEFKAGRIDILVATDIVARGIDIDDISMVVNYDVPREAEDYVHRIGRTARAGSDGRAVTLVSEREQSKFKFIEDFIGREVRKEQLPDELGDTPEYRPRSRDGRNRRNDRRHSSSGRRRNDRRRGAEQKDASKASAAPDSKAPQNAQSTPSAEANTAQNAEVKPKKKRRYYRRRPSKPRE